MTPNSVSVDPEMAAALGDCQPGESKQMLITVTVNTHDEEGITATITGVEPYVAPAEEEAEEAVEPAPTAYPAGSGSKALQQALVA